MDRAEDFLTCMMESVSWFSFSRLLSKASTHNHLSCHAV